MITLFYDYELVKKIFKHDAKLFPVYRNYGIITINIRLKNSKISDKVHIVTTITPQPDCLSIIKNDPNEVPCRKLIELFDHEPAHISLTSEIDTLIITVMKIVHKWGRLKHINTPFGKVKFDFTPAPDDILRLHNITKDLSTGFTDLIYYTIMHPLDIGDYTTLIQTIELGALYWIAKPHKTSPTFEDYVRKHITLTKKYKINTWFMRLDDVLTPNLKKTGFSRIIDDDSHSINFEVVFSKQLKTPVIVNYTYMISQFDDNTQKVQLKLFSILTSQKKWKTYIALINMRKLKYATYEITSLPYSKQLLSLIMNWNKDKISNVLWKHTDLFNKTGLSAVIEKIVNGEKL